MKAVVRHISLPAGRRVLVISDIHGMLTWLQALLERVAFTQDDVLILLGDLLEKGPESLETLRYVIALSQTHTVYTVAGNCDGLVMALEPTAEFSQQGIMSYMKGHPESVVHQMAAEIGLVLESAEDLPRVRQGIFEHFAPELDFLAGLPTILEDENYVFVHGGVPSYEHMEELSAWSCMKNDNFLGQGHSFPKYCIVGHWPVTLYREGAPCCDPLIEEERKIICIDGGCGIKADGQLNALVLPQEPGGELTWVRYDGCPLRRALDAQEESQDPFTTHWTDNEVEVLAPGGVLTLCNHKSSGRHLHILNKFLRFWDGRIFCEDSTDYFLGVEPGDVLSVVVTVGQGALVKKNGVTGWYYGRLESIETTEKSD